MSAARYDSGMDAATILVDMVRIRPVAFDLTNRAVGVTVLAVTDLCVVEKRDGMLRRNLGSAVAPSKVGANSTITPPAIRNELRDMAELHLATAQAHLERLRGMIAVADSQSWDLQHSKLQVQQTRPLYLRGGY